MLFKARVSWNNGFDEDTLIIESPTKEKAEQYLDQYISDRRNDNDIGAIVGTLTYKVVEELKPDVVLD
jgi:hypothetical protein